MAEEHGELRGINWRESFLFVQIFKGFHMSLQASKIALALSLIVLVFLVGLGLDLLAGAMDRRVMMLNRDLPGGNEITAHAMVPGADLDEARRQWRRGQLEAAVRLEVDADQEARELVRYRRVNDQRAPRLYVEEFDRRVGDVRREGAPLRFQEQLDAARAADRSVSDVVSSAQQRLQDAAVTARNLVEESYRAARPRVEQAHGDDTAARREALHELERHRERSLAAIGQLRMDFAARQREIRGERPLKAFLDYQGQCLHQITQAVWDLNFTGGLSTYHAQMRSREPQPATVPAVPALGPARVGAPQAEQGGVFYWMLRSYRGAVWLLYTFPIITTIFAVLVLLLYSLFMGGLYRIAAVDYARDEKLGYIQAIKFALMKYWSFLTAPLIPIALILFLGALLLLGGLLGNVSWLAIIMGILFFLALILGVAIAFLSIGLVAGGGLMYPTIAVEGSDSLDAISRSFSYVFIKPWRAAWYALVALVYGVITYYFIRLFLFVALRAVHFFVSWGIWRGGEALGTDADRLDVLWTRPEFFRLWGPFNWDVMSGAETVAAVFIAIWVFPLAALAGAYLLSYMASSTTIIYFLLRRHVDATDLDDVYIEESEDDELAAEVAAASTVEPAGVDPAPQSGSAPPESSHPPQGETPTSDQREGESQAGPDNDPDTP